MARPRHRHCVVLVGWDEAIGRALEPVVGIRSVNVHSVRSIGGAIEVLDDHRNCLVIADVDAGIDAIELRRRMIAEGHGGVPTVLVARRGEAPRLPDDDGVVEMVSVVGAERIVQLAWRHCRVDDADDAPRDAPTREQH